MKKLLFLLALITSISAFAQPQPNGIYTRFMPGGIAFGGGDTANFKHAYDTNVVVYHRADSTMYYRAKGFFTLLVRSGIPGGSFIQNQNGSALAAQTGKFRISDTGWMATVIGTIGTATQPNITILGTLSGLTVSGAITNTSLTNTLVKTNLGGQQVAAIAGVDYATPGAISADEVLTRTGAIITANAPGTNLTLSGTIQAAAFTGAIGVNNSSSGTYRIPLISGTTTGNYPLNVSSVGPTLDANTGTVTLGGNMNTTGTITSGALSSTFLVTNNNANSNFTIPFINSTGTGQTTIFNSLGGATINPNTGNLTATTFTGQVITAAQPNITSLGTLIALTVSGNIQAASITTSGAGNFGTVNLPNNGTGTPSFIDLGAPVTSAVLPTPAADHIRIAAQGANRMQWKGESGWNVQWDFSSLSANRGLTIADISGSIVVTPTSQNISTTGNVGGANLTATGAITGGSISVTGLLVGSQLNFNQGRVLRGGTLSWNNPLGTGTGAGIYNDGVGVERMVFDSPTRFLSDGVYLGTSSMNILNVTGLTTMATQSVTGDATGKRFYTFEATGTVAGTGGTANVFAYNNANLAANTWYEVKVAKSRNNTTGFGIAAACYYYWTGDGTSGTTSLVLIGGSGLLSVSGNFVIITNADTSTNNWGVTVTKITTNQ